MTIREDLIKILANIGDDYAVTVDKLEKYIEGREREAFSSAINQDYYYFDAYKEDNK